MRKKRSVEKWSLAEKLSLFCFVCAGIAILVSSLNLESSLYQDQVKKDTPVKKNISCLDKEKECIGGFLETKGEKQISFSSFSQIDLVKGEESKFLLSLTRESKKVQKKECFQLVFQKKISWKNSKNDLFEVLDEGYKEYVDGILKGYSSCCDDLFYYSGNLLWEGTSPPSQAQAEFFYHSFEEDRVKAVFLIFKGRGCDFKLGRRTLWLEKYSIKVISSCPFN